MSFVLNLVKLPEVKRVTIDGKRYYQREGGVSVPYPSVTSVLSADRQKKKALMEWRKRIGEEEANRISTRASTRGTAAHLMIENYVQGIPNKEQMPMHQAMFNQLKMVADKYVNNIRCIEGQLYSDYLRCAGTVDMIAEFDGRLSVIDWKTSTKRKTRSQIYNYFKQESAYAVMFEEITGINVPRLVTIVSTEDQEPQIFIERRDDWINSFIELRDIFEEDNA